MGTVYGGNIHFELDENTTVAAQSSGSGNDLIASIRVDGTALWTISIDGQVADFELLADRLVAAVRDVAAKAEAQQQLVVDVSS